MSQRKPSIRYVRESSGNAIGQASGRDRRPNLNAYLDDPAILRDRQDRKIRASGADVKYIYLDDYHADD